MHTRRVSTRGPRQWGKNAQHPGAANRQNRTPPLTGAHPVKLVRIGVEVTGYNLTMIETGGSAVYGDYGEGSKRIDCSSVVMVTSRLPNDALCYALMKSPASLSEAGILSVRRIGDAQAPGLIAAALWSGHRFARELDTPPPGDVPFKRKLVIV